MAEEHGIANDIEIVPLEDEKITGNFEVMILGDDDDSGDGSGGGTGSGRKDELVHSKARGMGKALSRRERMAIVERIRQVLQE